MYGSRDEVVASVAVDGARAAAVAPLMAGAGGPVGDVAAAVRGVVAVARRVSEGAALSDEDLAGVGAVLTDVRVRDVLFTLVDCEALAGAAEGLWLQVARVVGWPFRGEALCLLAHAGYVRGDGVLAGVCVDAVLSVVSGHRFAGLLSVALGAGVEPSVVRGVTSGAVVSAVLV